MILVANQHVPQNAANVASQHAHHRAVIHVANQHAYLIVASPAANLYDHQCALETEMLQNFSFDLQEVGSSFVTIVE